jgi:hypothetical protein
LFEKRASEFGVAAIRKVSQYGTYVNKDFLVLFFSDSSVVETCNGEDAQFLDKMLRERGGGNKIRGSEMNTGGRGAAKLPEPRDRKIWS